MSIDALHDERYRIVQSRDARWDGRFVTAVHSTGIYCRPSCPARTPRSSGVTFYPTSAAAHLAGYRACKRCVPEATPGSPEWNVREDVAGRAMRLIGDGVVERDGVDGLSERLGYSTRQLARILHAELGAGPKTLSRAHRAQTARNLLTSSSLPVGDVAYASGFRSLRQFNDTVREVFDLTPTEIRSRRSQPPADAHIRVFLPARPPFDAAGVLAWLAARSVAGMEAADGTSYERTLSLSGGPAWFSAVPCLPDAAGKGAGVALAVRLTSLADLPTLVAQVRALFDLDADPVAVDAVLGAIPELAASVAATPGIRVPGTVDAHELVIRALVSQQVTVAAARTALRGLVEALGEPVPASIAPAMRLFPSMRAIAEEAEGVLRGPRRRLDTIVCVASMLADGSLVVDHGVAVDDLRRSLLAVPGIGPWTADYVTVRVRQHPDLVLPSDVAVRNGAQALGIPSEPRALSVWSERAAPWRSAMTMHLWRAAAAARPVPKASKRP